MCRAQLSDAGAPEGDQDRQRVGSGLDASVNQLVARLDAVAGRNDAKQVCLGLQDRDNAEEPKSELSLFERDI